MTNRYIFHCNTKYRQYDLQVYYLLLRHDGMRCSVAIEDDNYGTDMVDVTFNDGLQWKVHRDELEPINFGYSKIEIENLVEKIATFFEKEKNWLALKNCQNENGRSNDFRILVRASLNE